MEDLVFLLKMGLRFGPQENDHLAPLSIVTDVFIYSTNFLEKINQVEKNFDDSGPLFSISGVPGAWDRPLFMLAKVL